MINYLYKHYSGCGLDAEVEAVQREWWNVVTENEWRLKTKEELAEEARIKKEKAEAKKLAAEAKKLAAAEAKRVAAAEAGKKLAEGVRKKGKKGLYGFCQTTHSAGQDKTEQTPAEPNPKQSR